MNYIVNEVENIVNVIDYYNDFNNKSILITGATGLIGSLLVRTLVSLRERYHLNIKIYALARSEKKAQQLDFYSRVIWIYSSLSDSVDLQMDLDYVIHTASPTDSNFFVTNPVEVIRDTVFGLNDLLSKLKSKNITKFVLLSSLEVYGICTEDKFLNENDYYSIDSTNVRNCYSEGKKILECLSCSYSAEYNVPVSIVRLGQTFGPGVDYNDNRVFAQFARSVVEGKNIVLSTKGETKRSYCSMIDAVNGIFITLLRGENCQAYNLVSDNSYYSIYEMAEMFIVNTNCKIEILEESNKKYLSTIKFGLSTDKIKKLGFKSYENLKNMVDKLKAYFLIISKK